MYDLTFDELNQWSNMASFAGWPLAFLQSKLAGCTSGAGKRREAFIECKNPSFVFICFPFAWFVVQIQLKVQTVRYWPVWAVWSFWSQIHIFPLSSSVPLLCSYSYCVYLRVKQASAACKLKLWSAHLVRERLVCVECQSDAMSKSDRCGGDGLQSSRWDTQSELNMGAPW